MKITTTLILCSFNEDGDAVKVQADVIEAARYPQPLDPCEEEMYSIKNLELSIEGDDAFYLVGFEDLTPNDQDEVNLKLVTLYQEYKQEKD